MARGEQQKAVWVRAATLWLTASLGCAPSVTPPSPDDQYTTTDWPPAPPDLTIEDDDPVDPRWVGMTLDTHEGREVVCDLTWLGEVERVHEEGWSLRRRIRCLGATGAGWADLRFSSDAEDLAEFVHVGERIRVRIGEQVGFQGYPTFIFLATIGVTDAHEPTERSVSTSTDWERIGAAGDLSVHGCAVSYVGPIHATGSSSGITHSADVVCNSQAGERWVVMGFPDVTRVNALRVVRGEVVPARLVRIQDTAAAYPIVRYEGP